MSAIKIGSLVWSGYSGLLRVGTVVGKRIDDNGWAYFTVNWHDDSRYEDIQNYYRSINPNRKYGLEEYKASLIHPVDSSQLIRFARLHNEFIDDQQEEEAHSVSQTDNDDDVIEYCI